MKKVIIVSVSILVLILILSIAAFFVFGNLIIKGAINKLGPSLLKVPVEIENVHLNLLKGEVVLSKFTLGNPEGFKTPSMVSLDKMELKLNVRSLFSDTIVINKFFLYSPNITYEQGIKDSNFGALLKNLEKEPSKKAGESKELESKKPDKEGKKKKVIIEKFLIENPKINLSITAAGGKTLPIKITRIELNDIGKAEGGIAPHDVAKIIISTIIENVKQASSSITQLLGSFDDNAAVAIDQAQSVVTAATEKASTIIKGIGSFLKEKTQGQK